MSEKGEQLRVVQQQFTYAYLFDVVCIANGYTEFIITPFSNNLRSTEVGKHAVDSTTWDQEHYDKGYLYASLFP